MQSVTCRSVVVILSHSFSYDGTVCFRFHCLTTSPLLATITQHLVSRLRRDLGNNNNNNNNTNNNNNNNNNSGTTDSAFARVARAAAVEVVGYRHLIAQAVAKMDVPNQAGGPVVNNLLETIRLATVQVFEAYFGCEEVRLWLCLLRLLFVQQVSYHQ